MKSCKIKRENESLIQLTEKIETLENELKQVKCQKSTITNNTTNIQQNISIKNYGCESVSHLPKDFLTSCFMMKNIPSLIENLHFDEDCQENKNIKLKSLKHKIINVFQDDKWVSKPADTVLDELVNKGQTILCKHYKDNKEDVCEEMSIEEIDDVILWLTQIWENNERIRRPLKIELVALLENYR
jgi:hypothetical protein